MSNTVNPVTHKTSFHNVLPSMAGKEITREDEETFFPPAGKGWCELVEDKDLLSNPTQEQKNVFHKKWTHDMFGRDIEQNVKKYRHELTNNGYSKEQADSIIKYSYFNTERAKHSATNQESWGKIGSLAVNFTIVLGIIKNLFDFESNPTLKKIVDFAYGITRSIRSYCQGSIYKQKDDDAGKNSYEAEVYDNKIAGYLGNAATFTETKINSWALAIAELLPGRFKEPIKKILTSVTPLWFRARMPAHIRQSFFTDFFRWASHIISSLFGNKKSIDVINKVKERGNLKPSYFWERTCKLAGLNDSKDHTVSKLTKQIFNSIKGLFSSDLNKQKDSAKNLNETIAPTFGMYGFFAMTIGTVGSAVLKLLNLEDKFFNLLASSSITSQQLIYYPRLAMQFLFKAKELENDLKDPNIRATYNDKQIKNLKVYIKELRNLSYIGAICLILSTINTALKFENSDNRIFQKLKNILDETTVSLIQKFFSHRRHLIGLGFKLENPEFYFKENEQDNESAEAQKDVNVVKV